MQNRVTEFFSLFITFLPLLREGVKKKQTTEVGREREKERKRERERAREREREAERERDRERERERGRERECVCVCVYVCACVRVYMCVRACVCVSHAAVRNLLDTNVQYTMHFKAHTHRVLTDTPCCSAGVSAAPPDLASEASPAVYRMPSVL